MAEEKNGGNERGDVLDREGEKEETTLTVPRMAQILLSGGRCKKTIFGRGVKKLKYC